MKPAAGKERSAKSFRELGALLERNRCVLRAGVAPTVSEDNRTDEEVFREAMAGVREIPEFREARPRRIPKKAEPRCVQTEDGAEPLRRIVSGKERIRIADTGEYMEWIDPAARRDLTALLHHGRFAVQDTVDLHHLTLSEAEAALDRFFRSAVRHRLFCVKVIHGRGLRSPNGPVLKEAFKKMLHTTFRKWVLGYASARACDGGLGATYVLLR